MKILFICNQGQNRSKTAEFLFKDKYETKSAGIYENIVTRQQIEWADIIIVMEEEQKEFIEERFPRINKNIINLDIRDVYYFNQPDLKEMLKIKFGQLKEF